VSSILPPASFWASLPEDRAPGTAYQCACGRWRWAVALTRAITDEEKACPQRIPGCHACARLRVMINYVGQCPDCGAEWRSRHRI
jgi:hypothetical protein